MTYEYELNDAKKYLHNYCGLENCFVGGTNCWTPRQISWFCRYGGRNYRLYVNEDVLGDGLSEMYLDENPDDTDFEKFDEWLILKEAMKFWNMN